MIPPRCVPPVVLGVGDVGGPEHTLGNFVEAVRRARLEKKYGSRAVLGESGRKDRSGRAPTDDEGVFMVV